MSDAGSWPSDRTIGMMRERIATLSQVLGDQVPPVKANFQTPATRSAIEKAEKKLGMMFPKELKAYLLAANGQKLIVGSRPSCFAAD